MPSTPAAEGSEAKEDGRHGFYEKKTGARTNFKRLDRNAAVLAPGEGTIR